MQCKTIEEVNVMNAKEIVYENAKDEVQADNVRLNCYLEIGSIDPVQTHRTRHLVKEVRYTHHQDEETCLPDLVEEE